MACVVNANGDRPTLVIGIFTDRDGATRALDHLHRGAAGCFRLLSNSASGKERDPSGTDPADTETQRFLRRALTIDDAAVMNSQAPITGPPMDRDSQAERASLKVYRQLTYQLAEGADVVVVHADGPGQQLSASRILLQSSCDVLLTHECAQRT